MYLKIDFGSDFCVCLRVFQTLIKLMLRRWRQQFLPIFLSILSQQCLEGLVTKNFFSYNWALYIIHYTTIRRTFSHVTSRNYGRQIMQVWSITFWGSVGQQDSPYWQPPLRHLCVFLRFDAPSILQPLQGILLVVSYQCLSAHVVSLCLFCVFLLFLYTLFVEWLLLRFWWRWCSRF